MSTQESEQVPPSSVAAETSPRPSVDTLLSPVDSGFASRASVRDSQFTELTLDDESRFSTVPLSAGLNVDADGDDFHDTESIPFDGEPELSTQESADGPTEADFSTSLERRFSGSSSKAVHRKSTSFSSAHSTADVTRIVSRLDLEQNDDDPESNAHRRSVEGQHKLQEEFARVQNEQQHAEYMANGGIDWNFWGQVMGDYHQFASQNSQALARAIERGIPHTLRGMMWQLMSASKDPELESTYLNLLKEPSSHEKAITRDLGRTFPHHDFFTDGQGIGQENLFNVLKAYSLYDPQVGYCQGLPFVVAVLLLNMPDEEAFSLLVRLMHSYDLRGHFLPEMPKLQLRLFQFDRLIEELLPVLHVHFLRQGVKSSMFCSQWFLTMFSYRFPLDIVFRIYDNCLANGIEAIFSFSIALLERNEEALLSLKFDQILAFLKNRLFERYQINPSESVSSDSIPKDVAYKVDEFVQDALSVKITPFMLDSYAHEYEELVRARDAHALELDALRNNNRNLSAQVKRLEAGLAQLNEEHCEIVKELVMTRIKYEEVEGELVRYKLLYAEAVHMNEDASHRISLNSRRGSRNT